MQITLTLEGTNPLLMHNERLANKLDPIVRQMAEITSKRKKTDDDLLALARLEFEGGLYLNTQGPYIPGYNVKRCFIDGGKINKLGKAVERAFTPMVAEVPLTYKGPRDVQEMWDAAGATFYDMRSVKVGTSKVTRCRPRFEEWELSLNAELDTSVLNLSEFEQVAVRAGLMVGLGDYRQRFGRFDVTVSQ
jgi:hypothetical protein